MVLLHNSDPSEVHPMVSNIHYSSLLPSEQGIISTYLHRLSDISYRSVLKCNLYTTKEIKFNIRYVSYMYPTLYSSHKNVALPCFVFLNILNICLKQLHKHVQRLDEKQLFRIPMTISLPPVELTVSGYLIVVMVSYPSSSLVQSTGSVLTPISYLEPGTIPQN